MIYSTKIDRYSLTTGWAEIPSMALIDGDIVTDMERWRTSMTHWLQNRFAPGDGAIKNEREVALTRVEASAAAWLRNLQLDGTAGTGPSLWCMTQAWAKAAPGKVGGPDHITVEMVVAWPRAVKTLVWKV
ncbi:MAG: hypothetical protein ACKPKO_39595, partial [Candidatus Fonsibacter sp.]